MSWAWTSRDFPYAVITPAALLNDYKPLDPDKPSIPADIQPGDKIYRAGGVRQGAAIRLMCGAEGYSPAAWTIGGTPPVPSYHPLPQPP